MRKRDFTWDRRGRRVPKARTVVTPRPHGGSSPSAGTPPPPTPSPASFPLTYTDGTYTHELAASSWGFTIKSWKNATPTVINVFQFDASNGDLNERIRNDWNVLVWNDWNVSPPGGGTNRDWNVEFDRDVNHNAGRDYNLDVGRNLSLNAAFLSFFGVAPAAQQATPVTLADVIALLQAYGLSA